MDSVTFRGRSYRVDDLGFLRDWRDWDEGFAEAAAPRAGIPEGLTPRHWEVIHYVRTQFRETGVCPFVFSTCRALGIRLRELETLFPTGYQRGACRLAGITYQDRFVNFFGEPARKAETGVSPGAGAGREGDEAVQSETLVRRKVYRVDAWGFLVDPAEWDAIYASNKAREMKSPPLTGKHWEILDSLRRAFEETGRVPTVMECCRANGLELDDLEALFPDGYHRGAVKIAGLCIRPPDLR